MSRDRTFAVSAAIVLVLIGVGGFAAYRYYQGQVHSPRRVGQTPVVVDIAPGTGVAGTGDILAQHGIIGSTLVFEIYVRTHGLADRLEAGHFTIPGGISMAEALALLSHAQGAQVRVTIPEGYTTKQVAALMEQKGLFSAASYIAAANGGTYSQPFLTGRTPGYGLEGYLFPDTYFFDAKAKPADVINEQVSHFGQKVPADLRRHAADQHLTFAQAVVMASIIEREARFDNDRPYIAAVFYKRLAQGMALEADATLFYAKNQVGGRVTEDDKKINSPFNTYIHPGLPPAPISNPGLASIQAALIPAPGVDYLFYVTDPAGHAHFSRTLAEHDRCQVSFTGCATAP
jgi:UPF0755 protein